MARTRKHSLSAVVARRQPGASAAAAPAMPGSSSFAVRSVARSYELTSQLLDARLLRLWSSDRTQDRTMSHRWIELVEESIDSRRSICKSSGSLPRCWYHSRTPANRFHDFWLPSNRRTASASLDRHIIYNRTPAIETPKPTLILNHRPRWHQQRSWRWRWRPHRHRRSRCHCCRC